MFQNFDKLMILKNGKQIYFDHSKNVVSYMENLGVNVDYRMNPADFFMLELSSFQEEKGHKTLMTA